MTALRSDAAMVLFSGGQDSATCLAWALDRFGSVETLGFSYGQRHAVELHQRSAITNRLRNAFPAWSGKLGADTVLDAPTLGQIGQTAMTADVEIEMGESGLPTTFVPGRNLLFLTFAAALAYRRGIKHIVTGVCETDYSGYPDCRDDTIKALQAALNLGMDTRLVLHTPLMWIDKAGTWRLTQDLGGEALVDLIRVESHSCYLGDRSKEHAWGFGCGECPACELRADGWARWIAA
ncbi:MAG: 7-cyano-7-deazaguanine synthase QueC [Pseudomonadota bacterium]